ncbi:MAG: alanine racemase [Sedimentisphaerales bacterium]|nr:alanine racemase [Sedimentisphaerales bacterium]
MAQPHYLIAEIDLAAIKHNLNQLRKIIGPSRKMCVTVKANAYGHGVEVVLRAMQEGQVDMLAVAAISESQQLRELGWRRPILLLGSELSMYEGPQKRQLAHWLVANDVRVSITQVEDVKALATASRYIRQPAVVHAMLDTGMGRMGLDEKGLLKLLELVRDTQKIELEGLYTHFATADESDQTFAFEQLRRFALFRHKLEELGLKPLLVHTANSSATITLTESHFDMVRPGIAVMGCLANPALHQGLDLKPALRLTSCLTLVKRLAAGSTIGYGCTYRAEREMLVGVVPIGYADGYDRRFSNIAQMLIAEHPAPIVGRVSMDMTVVDLTNQVQAGIEPKPGDEVVVIDNRRTSPNSVEHLAGLIDTVPYELLTCLGRRATRRARQLQERTVRVDPTGSIRALAGRRRSRLGRPGYIV